MKFILYSGSEKTKNNNNNNNLCVSLKTFVLWATKDPTFPRAALSNDSYTFQRKCNSLWSWQLCTGSLPATSTKENWQKCQSRLRFFALPLQFLRGDGVRISHSPWHGLTVQPLENAFKLPEQPVRKALGTKCKLSPSVWAFLYLLRSSNTAYLHCHILLSCFL